MADQNCQNSTDKFECDLPEGHDGDMCYDEGKNTNWKIMP